MLMLTLRRDRTGYTTRAVRLADDSGIRALSIVSSVKTDTDFGGIVLDTLRKRKSVC